MTPRFHRLTIRDVRRETPDSVSIALDVPPELAADYAYAPGQYLTLRAELDGEEIRRSYSISSGPDDGELRIGVKRVVDGAFSTFANEILQIGHAVDVMTPTGRFGAGTRVGAGGLYAAFAAGSGITPVLSIMRGILGGDPAARFFLFYGNRSARDVMFRTALDDLKDGHLGRVSVFHVLSGEEQDLAVLNGRLDAAKATTLLTHIVPAAALDGLFVCGPPGMAEAVEAAAHDLGIRADRVHVERFVSQHEGRPRTRPPKPGDAAPVATPIARAGLIVDGKRREVPIAEGETVLDAALRAGLDLPYACRGGMCSTCRAKIVEGEVAMDVNYSLEPWELASGFVLTCQARPQTPALVVDFDHV